MKLFEVAKRVVPFAVALVLGVILAMPFASVATYDEPVEDVLFNVDVKVEHEDDCDEFKRMKREFERLKQSEMFDHELSVPEPPMPPEPPVAPVAPLAPPPPPPPPAPVRRSGS